LQLFEGAIYGARVIIQQLHVGGSRREKKKQLKTVW